MLILGFWFWGLAIVECIVLTFFVEIEEPLPAILSLIVFTVFIWWLADIPVWSWIGNNPGTLLMYCLYYVIIGLFWSFVKYYFLLKSGQRDINKIKEKWNSLEEHQRGSSFRKFLDERTIYTKGASEFSVSTKKLVVWSSLWPTSVIWTLINDPIKRFFKFLVNDVFIGAYKHMYYHLILKYIDKVDEETEKENNPTEEFPK